MNFKHKMTFNIKHKSICGREGDDRLELFFDEKDRFVILEHVHGKDGIIYFGCIDDKQKMTFYLNCLEHKSTILLNKMVKKKCCYQTTCKDGTIQILHLAEYSQDLST